MPKKESKLVAEADRELLRELNPFTHTITSDNRKEFALHKQISCALEIDFYIAKPYCSCERGANENQNGLLKQNIAKSTSFEYLTNEKKYEIQEKINNQRRKKFNFELPDYMFSQKGAFIT